MKNSRDILPYSFGSREIHAKDMPLDPDREGNTLEPSDPQFLYCNSSLVRGINVHA